MNIVRFDSPEAAERAAWMLMGNYLNENRVAVPEHNSDRYTLDSVAAMVCSSWNCSDLDSEADDYMDESGGDPSVDEIEDSNTDIVCEVHQLSTSVRSLSVQVAVLASRLEPRPQVSAMVPSSVGQRSPLQEFDRLIAAGFTTLLGKNFSNVDFSGRSLTNLNFNNSDLSGANFDNCRLYGCSFEQANLRGASFANAQMPGVSFSSACLSNANFQEANLCNAQLDWTNLRDAMLCDADLSHANLESSNLSRADLSDADVSNANLSSSKLEFAKCIGTQFVRAKLKSAYVEGAELAGASFAEADLTEASFWWCKGFNPDLHENVIYCSTKMPGGKVKSNSEIVELPRENLVQYTGNLDWLDITNGKNQKFFMTPGLRDLLTTCVTSGYILFTFCLIFVAIFNSPFSMKAIKHFANQFPQVQKELRFNNYL